MVCLEIFSLLALFSSGIQSASLPLQDGYQWHFNQAGVKLDLALKEQTSLLAGGKAHVELPISAVWKLIESENQLLKPLVIALEKTTLGRIYDVMTVTADITFNAEKILEGIFNIAVDYTLVHKDGTEEKATLLVQGKNESGKLVTSVEVITKKSLETISKQIFFPVSMIVTCDWPHAHTVTIKGSFGKLFINIANDINEVSVKGMLEYLGTQYMYSTVLSIKEKSFTVTYQKPTEEPKNVVVQFKALNGYPRIVITGNVPTCRWFKAGIFKTELIVNNLFDYEIKHIHNGIELFSFNIAIIAGKIDMTVKYGLTHKTQMVIVYEYMKMIKIEFPLTNTWLSGNKNLGIEMQYQPTNEASLLEGGNIKIVAMRDAVPIMNIGGYYGLTIDATKYEILLNDVTVTLMKPLTGISFSQVKFFGKIFFDRLNKNGLINKLSVETKFEKDGTEMFNILLTTVETPYRLHVFYPYLLKNVFKIHNVEHVEITHGHVVLGQETTITTTCNLTSKKLIAKITPTMMTYELLDGEVSLVKYTNEITQLEVGTSSYLLEGKTSVLLNPNHLCYLPASLCFNDLTTAYHLEVVDLTSGKVNVKVQVTKDTLEILHVEIKNVETPYKIILKAPVLPFELMVEYELTTKGCKVLINFMNMKSILKVKPTVGDVFEVDVNGIPLLKMTLVNKELKITTIMKDLPAITATVTWKTLSMFENTLGLELLCGKIVHKTVLGWNINMLKKAFIDIKMIGSGTILGNYEVLHHLNWNIINIKTIDLEWNSKVLSTGVKVLATPLVTEGKLIIKNFVIDMLVVEKFKTEPYTLIFKTKPLKIALLPFFQYP